MLDLSFLVNDMENFYTNIEAAPMEIIPEVVDYATQQLADAGLEEILQVSVNDEGIVSVNELSDQNSSMNQIAKNINDNISKFFIEKLTAKILEGSHGTSARTS